MAQHHHKTNFRGYIEPNYKFCDKVDATRTRAVFQEFLDQCLATLPDDGTPKNGYAYNAHMGAFVRALDNAKDEFVKAQQAFFAEKNMPE